MYDMTNRPSGLSSWLADPRHGLSPAISTVVWHVMPGGGSGYCAFDETNALDSSQADIIRVCQRQQ
jgi:hypothetical protein